MINKIINILLAAVLILLTISMILAFAGAIIGIDDLVLIGGVGVLAMLMVLAIGVCIHLIVSVVNSMIK